MTTGPEKLDIFPWNSNFETGITIIDEQHQELVALLNALAGTLVHNDPQEITRAFDALAAYAEHHFGTEEKIWLDAIGDDAWIDAHKDSHDDFLPQVIRMREEDADKALPDVVEDIIQFLIRWIAYHIIDSDQRMALLIQALQQGCSMDEAKKAANEGMTGASRLLIETVMSMYENLSSRTLDLLRERIERRKAEVKLREAMSSLEKQAITDQLTGLYNRRHFETVFQREFRRARRDKTPLTFIMFDIDYFKKLNDHYGHAIGDDALKEVSAAAHEACRRASDFVFRIGGEEFAVLIAGQDLAEAIAQADHIRNSIAKVGIPHEKSDAAEYVTISAGVVSHIPNETENMDSFMKAADRRLYIAKESGRNQVVYTG